MGVDVLVLSEASRYNFKAYLHPWSWGNWWCLIVHKRTLKAGDCRLRIWLTAKTEKEHCCASKLHLQGASSRLWRVYVCFSCESSRPMGETFLVVLEKDFIHEGHGWGWAGKGWSHQVEEQITGSPGDGDSKFKLLEGGEVIVCIMEIATGDIWWGDLWETH